MRIEAGPALVGRRCMPRGCYTTPGGPKRGDDEVYVANMGPNYAEMIEAYGREVLPGVRVE